MADEVELRIDEATAPPADGVALEWLDREQVVAVLRRGEVRELVAIHPQAGEWVVVLRGRPIRVTVRSHRDRLLAETSRSATRTGGPAEVRASLPGLVVRVAVAVGDIVAAGEPLVAIEAMKMQNEIRAPGPGRVVAVEVSPGQTIAAGALLVRLADADP